ncbi:hypothetical protein CI610_00550 [invertebrate metagenome]|uniref:Threonine/Serine exporter ThrE domain-containing protein n=1 Tax=invertebrate metagenome TaxID=1711999 RepID=A0A2H9TB94_9ZZZZ
MDMLLLVVNKCSWAIVAALGFAVMFSVPKRALWAVALLSALLYGLRIVALYYGVELVVATFIAVCFGGLISIRIAHWVNSPTMVFMVPAVIPMVPGISAYRAMMGLMQITRSPEPAPELLYQTVSNGLTALFVILALAVGVSLPALILRNRSIREVFGWTKSYHYR